MSLHAFSFGGGVQSTAALVLAAEGRIPPRLFIFANVGDDSENPATLTYVNDVAKPYAAAHGIELVEVAHARETLLGRLHRDTRSLGIPVRMLPDGAPGRRGCTGDFKIKQVAALLKARGATGPGRGTRGDPATLHLGISLDEFQRMRTDSGFGWVRLAYPLIDLRLDRAACMTIIERAGLPVPPKSSCWFCPLHSRREWEAQRRDAPALYAQSADLEDLLNRRRASLGKDMVFFSRDMRPLRSKIGQPIQPDLFAEDTQDNCESGYCHV